MTGDMGVIFARGARWFAFSAHLAVVAIATMLMLYAHPQIDDLWRAAHARDLGILGAVQKEYLGWTGRWAGIGLSYTIASLTDIRYAYGFLLLALGVCVALAVVFLLRSLFGADLPRLSAGALAVSVLALYWTEIPSPGDTFYWLSGGLEYHLGLALLLVAIGWLVRISRRERPGRAETVEICVLAALGFVLPGVHELYGVFFCLIVLAGTVVAFLVHHRRRKVWATIAALAVFGFLVVYAAPGNAQRMATEPGAGDIQRTLWLIARQLPRYILEWVVDVKLLAATFLFVVHPRIRSLRPPWTEEPSVPWRWIVPGMWLLLISVGFAGHAWGTGVNMPPRTAGALYLTFIFGWFAVLLLRMRHLENGFFRNPPRGWMSAALVGLGLGLLASDNARAGLRDLREEAPMYDLAMRSRYQLLEDVIARGGREAVVPALPMQPRLFFHADVVNDPTHYQNYHTKKFYRLESLKVVPDKGASSLGAGGEAVTREGAISESAELGRDLPAVP